MRPKFLFVILLLIPFALAQIACPSRSDSPSPPRETGQTDDPATLDLSGTDPVQLVDQWRELDQDPEYLIHLLDPDETGQYPDLLGWRISGLSDWNADSWEFPLDSGTHLFIACGGNDIEDINLGIYVESEGMLGSDNDPDKIPSVMFELESDVEATIEVIPVSYTEEKTEGIYAMFYL